MALPVSTWIDQLLLLVKQQIIDNANQFDDNTVMISVNPNFLQKPPSDQWIFLTPTRIQVDQRFVAGGGNDALYLRGGFILTLWSRLYLDTSNSDEQYLTDQSLGVIATVKQIIYALQLFQPKDSAGNMLIVEPMRSDWIEFDNRDFEGVGYGLTRLGYSLNWFITGVPVNY